MAAPTAPQHPTLESTRIRSPRDAFLVFNGVAMNVLPLITRRLDIEERRGINSGNVYVWEERGVSSEAIGLGMERWTDGMGWGPSRVRDGFLFYHQKPEDDCVAITQISPWSQATKKSGDSSYNFPGYLISSTFRHLPETRNLIKQTYSVHVSLPTDRIKGLTRKWHLTAYFNQDDVDTLRTVDMITPLISLRSHDSWFRSARTTKSSRRDHRASRSSSATPPRSTHRRHSPSSDSEKSLDASFPLNGRATQEHGFQCDTRRSNPLAMRATLVPLECLQKVSPPHRNLFDEQALRRFARSY